MRFELLALTLVVAVGCGASNGEEGPGGDEQCTDCDENQGLTCELLEFEACGGDIVGEWNLTEYCGDPVEITDPVVNLAECATSYKTLTLTPLVLTQTFNANLTYHILATSKVSFVADASPECVQAIADQIIPGLPFATACNYGESILTDGQDQIEWDEAPQCSVDAGRCKCMGSGTTKDITDSGTYTTNEGTVTLTSQDPDFSEFDGDTNYCIVDGQLTAEDTTDEGQVWHAIFDPES